MTETTRKGSPLLRPLFFVCGLLLVGVGVVGYLTPGVPGTIFLILAAGCFARSSPRLEAWLINHPRLGPSVVAWRENGAIPRKIKYIAIGSMSVSFLIVLVIHLSTMWTAIIGVAMLASALGSLPASMSRAPRLPPPCRTCAAEACRAGWRAATTQARSPPWRPPWASTPSARWRA